MDEVIAATGFKGTFAEFLKFINTDPRFFFTDAGGAARAPTATSPSAPTPSCRSSSPSCRACPTASAPWRRYEGDNADHYSRPAIDGSRAGFFDANVNNLENRPSYEMEATLLHEAVPGHHLQIARAQELKDLPLFRRAGGYVAYGEGWGLYAESLGYEMGFYKDPYMRFGALWAEALRACRLVIDTGIHTKGWGREQSIRYMMDNARRRSSASPPPRSTATSSSPGAGARLQDRRAAHQGDARQGEGRAGRTLRPAPLPQRGARRRRRCRSPCSRRASTNGSRSNDEGDAPFRGRDRDGGGECRRLQPSPPRTRRSPLSSSASSPTRIEEQPELGTYFGIDGYDHRVTDLSPQAVARRNARVAKDHGGAQSASIPRS